jgi:transposase
MVSEMIQEDAQRCLELEEKIRTLEIKIKQVAKDPQVARILLSIPALARSALQSWQEGWVQWSASARKAV